jgi:ParB family chromosome partitioning protein
VSSEVVEQVDTSKVLTVKVSAIRPSADQPRTVFDQDALEELGASIKEFGQQVAIIVRELVGDEAHGQHKYEIIDGERRHRAHQLIGKRTIRCELRGAANRDHQFLQSIVANFGRRDHTTIEAALACARICAMQEYAELPVMRRYDRVGALFARSGEWVKMQLRVAKLPQSVHNKIADGKIGAQLAWFLCSVKDPDDQERLANTIVDGGYNAPKARNLIRDHLAKTGHATGRSVTRPSETSKLFFANVQRISSTTETLLDMPRSLMTSAFVERPAVRQALLERVDQAISGLEQLKSAIESKVVPIRPTVRRQA